MVDANNADGAPSTSSAPSAPTMPAMPTISMPQQSAAQSMPTQAIPAQQHSPFVGQQYAQRPPQAQAPHQQGMPMAPHAPQPQAQPQFQQMPPQQMNQAQAPSAFQQFQRSSTYQKIGAYVPDDQYGFKYILVARIFAVITSLILADMIAMLAAFGTFMSTLSRLSMSGDNPFSSSYYSKGFTYSDFYNQTTSTVFWVTFVIAFIIIGFWFWFAIKRFENTARLARAAERQAAQR